MGIIVSRYMDPSSSEGALVKFIVDSLKFVRTVCTADAYFPELTPWNVIDFRSEDLREIFTWAAWLGFTVDSNTDLDAWVFGNDSGTALLTENGNSDEYQRVSRDQLSQCGNSLDDTCCHSDDLLYISSTIHVAEAI